jgi:hypothetical protein
MADLIGNHLDLYRKNQADIGVKVMITLSSEERDEMLKNHLLASKELHPALLSSEYEHKVIEYNFLSFILFRSCWATGMEKYFTFFLKEFVGQLYKPMLPGYFIYPAEQVPSH